MERVQKTAQSFNLPDRRKLESSGARMMNPVVVNNYTPELEVIVNDLNLAEKPHCVLKCYETSETFSTQAGRFIADKKS